MIAEEGDVVYSRHPLPGARVLKGTPEETFFTRGQNLPKKFLVSMGVTSVTVRPKDKPRLTFRKRQTSTTRRAGRRRR